MENIAGRIKMAICIYDPKIDCKYRRVRHHIKDGDITEYYCYKWIKRGELRFGVEKIDDTYKHIPRKKPNDDTR